LLGGAAAVTPPRSEGLKGRKVTMRPRRSLIRKVVVAALVGIPWIPLAAALYAWLK
jgi:hypothetical protein